MRSKLVFLYIIRIVVHFPALLQNILAHLEVFLGDEKLVNASSNSQCFGNPFSVCLLSFFVVVLFCFVLFCFCFCFVCVCVCFFLFLLFLFFFCLLFACLFVCLCFVCAIH